MLVLTTILSDSLKITGEYDEENHTQRSRYFICITLPPFYWWEASSFIMINK